MGLKMCKVTVGTRQKEYPDGTPYGEIVKDFDQDCKYPVVLVTVDGKNFTKRYTGTVRSH